MSIRELLPPDYVFGDGDVQKSFEIFLRYEDATDTELQEDEYRLLGMAIKYAGLRGKEVRVIGKNRSSLGEAEKVQ